MPDDPKFTGLGGGSLGGTSLGGGTPESSSLSGDAGPMLFTVNFGNSQTGVGYRFSTGFAFVSDRITTGISQIGSGGNYAIEVVPPATARVIYWDSTDNPYAVSHENFDLRLKVDSLSSVSAADIRAELAVELAHIVELENRLTLARSELLDKLDVTGVLAHSDAADTYKASVAGLASEGDLTAVGLLAEAIKAKTDLIPASPAAVGSEVSLSAATLAAVWSQADAVDGLSPAKILAVLAAVSAGTTEGFGEATVRFRDLRKILNRVTVVRDEKTKNRIAVTLNFGDFD